MKYGVVVVKVGMVVCWSFGNEVGGCPLLFGLSRMEVGLRRRIWTNNRPPAEREMWGLLLLLCIGVSPIVCSYHQRLSSLATHLCSQTTEAPFYTICLDALPPQRRRRQLARPAIVTQN